MGKLRPQGGLRQLETIGSLEWSGFYSGSLVNQYSIVPPSMVPASLIRDEREKQS